MVAMVFKHSRNMTILIIYCGIVLCTTPACFSSFYQSTFVPTLVENSYAIAINTNKTTLTKTPKAHPIGELIV